MLLKLFLFIFFAFPIVAQAKQFLPRTLTHIVIDAQSGKTIDTKGADILCHPASLTKMMTLCLTFEALQQGKITLNTRFPTSKHASRQMQTKLGLRPGEMLNVRQLITAVAVKSANDAAVVLAEGLAGSENAFAKKMTDKAKSIGMKQTVFKNAAGVPNPNQVTTARDMATLSRYICVKYPKYTYFFKIKQTYIRGHLYKNTNKLLGVFAGMDGLKTGYTYASGYNLAASAVRTTKYGKKNRLIAVLLGGNTSKERNRMISNLLEKNFAKLGSPDSAIINPLDLKNSNNNLSTTDSTNSMDLIIEQAISKNPKTSSKDEKVVKKILKSLNTPLKSKSKKKTKVKKNQKANKKVVAQASKKSPKKEKTKTVKKHKKVQKQKKS